MKKVLVSVSTVVCFALGVFLVVQTKSSSALANRPSDDGIGLPVLDCVCGVNQIEVWHTRSSSHTPTYLGCKDINYIANNPVFWPAYYTTGCSGPYIVEGPPNP